MNNLIEFFKETEEVKPCQCGAKPTLIKYSFKATKIFCPNCFKNTISSFNIKDTINQWEELNK